MSDAVQEDPILGIIRFAHGLVLAHTLKDLEAALYAAAFALCGPITYGLFAAEAAYYSSLAGGDLINTLEHAVLQRERDGILGTRKVALCAPAPAQNEQHFTG